MCLLFSETQQEVDVPVSLQQLEVCVAEKDSDLKETAKFARIQEREHFFKKIESLKIKKILSSHFKLLL